MRAVLQFGVSMLLGVAGCISVVPAQESESVPTMQESPQSAQPEQVPPPSVQPPQATTTKQEVAPVAPLLEEKERTLFLVIDKGQIGYIDENGRLLIALQYKRARDFSDGRAAVQVGRKWGYIDTSGRMAIPAQFDYALSFEHGHAIVEKGKQSAVIDMTGTIVVAPSHKKLRRISEGKVSFESGGKMGLLDLAGKELIPPIYDHLSPPKDSWCLVKKQGRSYFINISGKTVLDPADKGDIAWEFSEGLTPIRMKSKHGRAKGKHRWGFIDRKGNVVIEPRFVRVHRFSQGMATVETDPKMGFLWGYIDKTGKLLIQPKWHHTEEFTFGLAVVKVGEKFGFIDKKGKLVIPAIYDWVSPFKDGLARVQFYSCADEHRDRKGVCQEGRQDKVGYIDSQGNYRWKPTPKR